MPIRKLTKSKRLAKSKRLTKSRKTRKSTRLSKSKHNYKSNNKYKNINKYKNKKYSHRGGFFGDSSCNIASVKEPAFNLAPYTSGSTTITGFSIPEQKGMIFNPNCTTSANQAMAP